MENTGFDIVLSVKKNAIYCDVVKTGEFDEALEYAYYLKRNQERVAVRWYRTNSKVKFLVHISGIYSVTCFIKHGEDKLMLQSADIEIELSDTDTAVEDIQIMDYDKIPISIYGSCVSRDVFEYDKKNVFDLRSYFCRQAVVSLLSAPVPCKIEEINLTSNFQKRQIYHDFRKDALECLEKDGSDYLIIDLIDERFALAQYKGSLITNSTSLMESSYVSDLKIIEYVIENREYWIGDNRLSDYIDEFSRRILRIYDANKIIIHKAFMLDDYLDGEGNVLKFSENYQLQNRKINTRLEYMYNRLIENLGDVHVVDICRGKSETLGDKLMLKLFKRKKYNLGQIVAVENHKWGLAPMHYCDEYYQCVLQEINKICKTNFGTVDKVNN